MRPLVLLALSLVSTALLAAEPPKPVITVTVRGDHVEYDQVTGTLTVHGRTTVTAQSDQPGVPTVSIASGQLEVDLERGTLIAHEEVRLLSQQLAMRGQEVRVDFRRAEFCLTQGAAAISLENPRYPGRPVRGFLFAQDMCRRADVIYMVEGRLTTCDRPHPHYSLGVSQLSFNTQGLNYSLRNGRLELYGRRLTIPGHYATKPRDPNRTNPIRQLLPGYSSYEGLYLPVTLDLTPRRRKWDVSLSTHLGTRFRFPGEIRAERETPRETLAVWAARREEVTWDLAHGSYLNRVPAVRWERHVTAPTRRDTQFDLALEASYIEEKPLRDTTRNATRTRLEVSYSPQAQARREHRGWWLGLEGLQSFYDTGQSFTDVQAELGLGADLSSRLRGAAWFVHHELWGSTPFRFDDVYAQNEVFGELETELGGDWFTRAYARFDTDTWHLRDLQVSLHRRVHCLTWGVTYDRARERWGLAVDLSGLTGNTPPYAAKPLVAPEEVPPLPPMAPGPAGGPFQLTLPGATP